MTKSRTAMIRTTMGRLLVDQALPPDLRDQNRVLDKKGMSRLLRELAEKHPDKYVETSQRLNDIGRNVAMEFGGYSFGLDHLRKSAAGQKYAAQVRAKVKEILDDDNLSPEQRNKAIVDATSAVQQKQIDDIYNEAVEADNPLALQVLSGSRGNKMNLASLLGSDMLYSDHRDNVIPLPVTRSFSQGLTPVEYWASTYGARRGTMATKFATQDAGFLCLAEGTEVRTPDGATQRIEAVVAGSHVLGADAAGNTFPVEVTAVFDNGPREVWRYYFRVGKARNAYICVEATEDHKVLAKMKRGRLGTPHGDKNSIKVPTQLPLRRASTGFRLVPVGPSSDAYGQEEPLALLIGLLIGDGGLTGNNINFSTDDTALVASLNRRLKSHGFSLSAVTHHVYEYILLDERPHPYKHDDVIGNRYATGFRHRLRAKLHDLGLLGKYAHEKTIPDLVYLWNNVAVADLLAGLYEADGCVSLTNNSSVPALVLAMTSYAAVNTARDLLAFRFGIHSPPVRTVPAEKYRGANHDVHVLCINDRKSVERFAERIPMPGVKGRKLRELLQTAKPSTRDDEFTYSFVRKEFVGVRQTYDIEVDHPDHLFVLANGAIVSNSKQLNQVAHRLMVVDEDDPRDIPHRGLPVDSDDPDNEGALLAKDVGPYRRNTVLTPKILKNIKGLGHDRILVRSPLVGGSPDGGVYSRDVGVRERGVLPGRGEQVGLTAAQALSEPLSQGQLSAKHSGGVAGQEKAVGGFAYINQLIQVPKKFKGGATHAELDGAVTGVEPAPGGGFHVYVNGQSHYVPAGVEPTVKKGDSIEAGDTLSDGFPHPGIVTKHKGTGEGKRYFVNAFVKAMKGAGMTVNRRNVELLARGLINHVRLTDEYGDYVPDDVLPYSTVEHLYEPRDGHELLHPDRALNKYLEKPVLHYSIGTKVRPSVLKELRHFGVDKVAVHADPPPFEPEMIRGMYSLQNDPDWMTRMYGSGLGEGLEDSVHRGRTSDEEGTSFVPGLARAVEFGEVGRVRQPEPGIKPPAEGTPLPELNIPKAPVSLKPPTQKKPGGFASLFKFSADDLEKEAAEILAKQVAQIANTRAVRPAKQIGGVRMLKTAEQPKVDSTLKPSGGSSTAAPQTATKLSPQGLPTGPNGTPPSAPAGPPTPKLSGGGQVVPATPQAAPPAPPPAASAPAPPGQVHPGRTAITGSWGGTPRSSPAATTSPFSGGMMSGFESPEQISGFIQGGGSAEDPDSGFGGSLGRAMRLGSLVDPRAIGTLTGGPNSRRAYGGPSDDLLGGSQVADWQEGNRAVSSRLQPAQPQAQEKSWLDRVASGLNLDKNWYERTLGQSATAIPAQAAGMWGFSKAVQTGGQVAAGLGRAALGMKPPVPAPPAPGGVLSKARAGLGRFAAFNTLFDAAANALPALDNYAYALSGDNIPEWQKDLRKQRVGELDDFTRQLQQGNSAESAWQGFQRPIQTIAAGANSIADVVDIKAQGAENMRGFARNDAWRQKSMADRAGAHQRYIEALDRGHPAQIPWTDPQTGITHEHQYLDSYRSAVQGQQQYAGMSDFERQTKGMGYGDRLLHDAANTPAAVPGLQKFPIAGTNTAIKPIASPADIFNPAKWRSGEVSLNPFAKR